MIKEKRSTLVGLNADAGCQMLDPSKRLKNNLFKDLGSRIWYLVSVLLLVSSILYLGSTSFADIISTNTANMNWTDARNNFYAPISDTAVIQILNPPILLIAKDVRNIRTGETSTDVVTAVSGDTIEFILNIENSGDTDARDVVMLDSIPFGTIYDTGSALDTSSFDTSNLPPDTITFQHIADGTFDETDTGIITAIKWQWDRIDGVSGYNKRVVKFRVRVQ